MALELADLRAGGDIRSNVHAGGRLRPAEVDDTMLRPADTVWPRLVEDGMFLVGLDIVGDKLMEINVFNPGGMGSARKFEKVNFARTVVEALQQKVKYMRAYGRNLSNVELAGLQQNLWATTRLIGDFRVRFLRHDRANE